MIQAKANSSIFLKCLNCTGDDQKARYADGRRTGLKGK